MIKKINSNNKFMFVINNSKGTHWWIKNILYLYDISSLRTVLGFIMNKLPFKWYEVPTMLFEKVSRSRLEQKFCFRVHFFFSYVCNKQSKGEHIDEYFPKNILYLYDISSLRKGNLNWPSLQYLTQ
jgi:hypothetical protein